METALDLKIRLAFLEQQFHRDVLSNSTIYNSVMTLGITAFFGFALIFISTIN